ncbi:benzoate/H(+) symporter BenE family transporter [Alcaligenes endophyticus]|uniref:Benzoate/H(+) symporter BenE family transporter n=1 Tax=Alcaligenes endophyticus TaxID=1929088 RepID=A0ABT8EIE3_9BURK|nr:benzoate/H(+) symporter BenE family transporter [Alcaligenes endophyticus]MCX5592598.1 benzoate/H(+) symporter BenE family transporter [Alcaligenes endophyticus]MDN4121054.1 benzoate/H(+) symporter BenE family transporter [Alcaligenes endophyticus]
MTIQAKKKSLFTHLQLSHISAGFIAVLVGYTSSVAIIFQAAALAGATQAQISSWMWALGLGLGVLSIGLSWRYKVPVLIAWSTPGAALLAVSLEGLSIPQAYGVFLFSSVLTLLCGLTGGFQKIMAYVPRSIAAAMLAGILLRFGMNLFSSIQSQWLLCLGMLFVFLLGRRYFPRYAIPLALLSGIALSAAQGLLHPESLSWQITTPVFDAPEFSWTALLGIGLPLFLVTMTSQNVPGVAVLQAHNYHIPTSPLISWTGLVGVLLAPFGGFAYNLAAISAALCMSAEVDPDPQQRYKAAMWGGVFYLLAGIFGASVVALFIAFPQELIAAIAGLALLGTITTSIQSALAESAQQEAAMVTFLCTASGMSLLGIGSAFWGLILGLAIYYLDRWRQRKNL